MNLRSLLLICLAPCAVLPAQVTLPKVLSNHMVVQRDLPVHIWGMAAPGEDVSVSFRGQTRSTKAGQLGRWSVYLSPGKAGGPFEMTVKGTPSDTPSASPQSIVLQDVMVGDVWVASGQSNMEFTMKQAETASQDLPTASNDKIRLLIVNKKAVGFPQDDIDSDGWKASAPESAKDFSAVAWYFAREIEQKENVPVGIIDSTWGGTPAEAWTRVTALGEDAAVSSLFTSWGAMTDEQADAVLVAKNKQRMIDEAKAQGKPAPQFPWTPNLESWAPGWLYNGMIAPLTPMAIRGAIWYQGESNSDQSRAPIYGRIFRDMIEDWRKKWGVGDFPFLFVQISNYKAGGSSDWPTLRDQQLKTLALKNTGMAVTIDIGTPDNIHPPNKLDVGHRLALAARNISYGESIEDSGPAFRQATPEGTTLRVWFTHASKGLKAKGDALTGFEVAGADHVFAPATASIDGDQILLKSDAVAEPLFVRYGWANSPQCNLFNGDDLPASPFNSAR